jgi:ubiquinone/menaquinone biosynthesis C-methylase UbiE
MLAIARHKAQGFGFDQCEFVQGDISRLDVPDNSQDIVLCSFALWGEPNELFAEFLRVLKPGGALLVQNWETERGGITQTYVESLRTFATQEPTDRIRGVRDILSNHRAVWADFYSPLEYERTLRRVGFGSASAQWHIGTTHFQSVDELIEFHDLGVWARAELAALNDTTRNAFHSALKDALQPQADERGVDEEWRAIQVVGRKQLQS